MMMIDFNVLARLIDDCNGYNPLPGFDFDKSAALLMDYVRVHDRKAGVDKEWLEIAQARLALAEREIALLRREYD